jgi:hypothetical protein
MIRTHSKRLVQMLYKKMWSARDGLKSGIEIGYCS